jgi:8-amino-7-oxononanoate synthase
MHAMTWAEWAHAELAALRRADRLRQLVEFDGGVHGTVGGRPVICFASNDYLGLAHHPGVAEAAREAIDRYGTGSTSSRLVVGTRALHAELEKELADWTGTQHALVFSSGFAANLGVLSTLGTADTTVFSDELNHASIIDGCRLSRAKTVIYRHSDIEQLESLLSKASGRKIVITDLVFSMDGDIAPVEELVRLCVRHEALLVLDEAHAVLGPEVPCHPELQLLRVGTLSKTLGSLGGWVAGPRTLIDLLINRARSFIYTTGLSPADVAAALAALRLYRSPAGQRLRDRLRGLVHRLRPGHSSPIVPCIFGEDHAALCAAEALLSRGLHVPAIRPPTVPAGTARLRIALSAAHTDEMLDRLQHALAEIDAARVGRRRVS